MEVAKFTVAEKKARQVRSNVKSMSIVFSRHPRHCLQGIRTPKIKLRLKGRRFDTSEEIHAETQEVIDTLTLENFQGCMKSWETWWDRCIHAQEDYFEGDRGN